MRPCYFCGKDFDTRRSDHICCPDCETKKPREFWIVPPEYKHKDLIDVMDSKPVNGSFTHVIEYAAYLKQGQALAKCNMAHEELETTVGLLQNHEVLKDLRRVVEENKHLKVLLKKISGHVARTGMTMFDLDEVKKVLE